MQAREAVAKWIEEQREERNAAALAWVIQRAVFALLFCYPPGQGQDALWGLFHTIAGAEAEGEDVRGGGCR